MKDRYECYKETQQRFSDAFVGPYGGSAGSQVIPSCSAFNACMASRGYLRSDTDGNLVVPQVQKLNVDRSIYFNMINRNGASK